MIELYTHTKTGRGIRALIAESQHDPSLAESLRDRFIASRRAEAATVFARGIERGELRPDLDIGVAAARVRTRSAPTRAQDAPWSKALTDRIFRLAGPLL